MDSKFLLKLYPCPFFYMKLRAPRIPSRRPGKTWQVQPVSSTWRRAIRIKLASRAPEAPPGARTTFLQNRSFSCKTRLVRGKYNKFPAKQSVSTVHEFDMKKYDLDSVFPRPESSHDLDLDIRNGSKPDRRLMFPSRERVLAVTPLQ